MAEAKEIISKISSYRIDFGYKSSLKFFMHSIDPSCIQNFLSNTQKWTKQKHLYFSQQNILWLIYLNVNLFLPIQVSS